MTSLTEARTLGESASNAALARANRCDPEWSDAVMTMLRLYARKMGQTPWSIETFRLWAHAHGLAYPTDNRAIGPLVRKAVQEGIIRAAGWASTISSRGSCRQTYVRAV